MKSTAQVNTYIPGYQLPQPLSQPAVITSDEVKATEHVSDSEQSEVCSESESQESQCTMTMIPAAQYQPTFDRFIISLGCSLLTSERGILEYKPQCTLLDVFMDTKHVNRTARVKTLVNFYFSNVAMPATLLDS
jgi:hypothetical protein